MDLDVIVGVFDAWTDIVEKARKAKGLDNWAKLQHVSSKLEGKTAKDITFTSSHPSYEGKPVKHTLGSVVGNQHFLLGYVNPAFHLAPYHWQIIDPYLEDGEVVGLPHPARPELWAKSGLPQIDEGDLSEGKPSPSVQESKGYEARKKAIKEESIPVQSGTGLYICVPSMGIVFSANTGAIYKWELIKDSFFAASNPEVAQKMNEATEAPEEEMETDEAPVTKSIPIEILAQSRKEEFANGVYPFVKNRFPVPGSVVSMSKSLYGLITADSIKFYNKEGNSVSVKVFDRVYKSFDLNKDGDVHPSILMNFANKYLGISKSLMEEYTAESEEALHKSNVVHGIPTQGYDSVPSTFVEQERNVIVVGNTYIAVPRASL